MAPCPSQTCLRPYEGNILALKVFGAEPNGSGYLEALRGSLPRIPFIPTGRVGPDNAATLVRADAVPRCRAQPHRRRAQERPPNRSGRPGRSTARPGARRGRRLSTHPDAAPPQSPPREPSGAFLKGRPHAPYDDR